MKIRNDFVTNSSSSSYIIAYRNLPKIDDETLKKYPFMKSFAKLVKCVLAIEHKDTSSAIIIHNIQELNHYFMECIGTRYNSIEEYLQEWDEDKDDYELYKKYLDMGYMIADKSVDYNDDIIGKLLENIATDNNDFIIIKEC